MNVILIPRPSQQASNPSRPANALLMAQVEHLQHAERRLPLKYRTDIYTHAIKTEGEAAVYIRQVTEAIHKAHQDAEARRVKAAKRPEKGVAIAAAAEDPSSKVGKKSSATKRTKK